MPYNVMKYRRHNGRNLAYKARHLDCQGGISGGEEFIAPGYRTGEIFPISHFIKLKSDCIYYFSVWFETVFQINWKMVNTIWFRFDLIRFRIDFSVWALFCTRVQTSVTLSCVCVVLKQLYVSAAVIFLVSHQIKFVISFNFNYIPLYIVGGTCCV